MAHPTRTAPIPPHWLPEHDHFLISYSHSPTIPARIRNSEAAIYEELLRTFLLPDPPSLLAVVQRIRFLTHAGAGLLHAIYGRGYWWAHTHAANPWGGGERGEGGWGEEGLCGLWELWESWQLW